MPKCSDLARIEFVEEDACRIAIRGDEKIRCVQNGLARTSVFVLSRNHHKSPGSYVRQEMGVIAGKRVCPIAPGEYRMLKPALAQGGRIINIEFVSNGIATQRADGHGNPPRPIGVILQLNWLRWEIGRAAAEKQRSEKEHHPGASNPANCVTGCRGGLGDGDLGFSALFLHEHLLR